MRSWVTKTEEIDDLEVAVEELKNGIPTEELLANTVGIAYVYYDADFEELRKSIRIKVLDVIKHLAERVEESEKVVMYWNENLFLSFSRSALVEKANQIKQEWLQTQYDNISKIASIDIRRWLSGEHREGEHGKGNKMR